MTKKRISHYEIHELLGEGGMGAVYKAVDLDTQNTVALKVLSRRSLAEEEIKRRFMREAKAGANLDHPAIVKIYEFGEEEGEYYLSMEYVEGRTLRHVVKEGPLPPDKAIDICIAAAEALAAAHAAGIIHRDIKSENIMLTPSGDVKVMDFGLAKLQDMSLLTQEGGVLGTVAYMSPQQASGETVDHRTDIFSLGVFLYELLTGKLPFGAEYEMAIIYSILNEDPVSVIDLNPQLPEVLDRVVVKALRKELNHRYQSADEFAADLKKVKDFLKEGQEIEAKELDLIAAIDKEKREVRGFLARLIGRDKEFEVLKKLLIQTSESEGQTVFIAGEAGIGKSRLVAELEKYARNKKITMLSGRCTFKQGVQPYQPFVEAIKNYFDIKGVGTDDRLREFVREKAPELTNRLPLLRMFLNIKEDDDVVLESKEQLWEAIFNLIVSISRERAIILFLDDMQWADEDTLNLFYYTSRNITMKKVMIAGTYRSEDVLADPEGKAHPLLEIQRQLNREGLLTVLELQRLAATDVHSMVDSLFPGTDFGEPFYEAVFSETEGNPFFAMEMLKLLRSEGIIEKVNGTYRLHENFDRFEIPGKIHDIVMMRIGRLNEEEREMLEVGAVEGESFQSDTIAVCLDLRRIHVLRKLQVLEREHHVIHPQDKMYRFDHGKIREILYDSILPELRTEYHLMIGDFFATVHEGQDHMSPTIAHHYLQGNNDRKALPYLITAGERARVIFANDQALEHYRNALRIIATLEKDEHEKERVKGKDIVLEGLGDVCLLTGKHDDAMEYYNALIDELHIGSAHWSDILRKLGTIYFNKGETDKALALLNEAEHSLTDTEVDDAIQKTIGKIKVNRARIYKSKGLYEDAKKEIEEGIRMLGNEGNFKERADAYNNLGNILVDQGDLDRAIEMHSKSLKLREEAVDQKGIAEAYNNLANVYYEKGDYRRTAEMIEKGMEIMLKIGFSVGIAGGYNNLGLIYQDMGRYADARSMLEKSLTIHKDIDDVPGMAMSLANLGSVNMDIGNVENALEQLEESLKLQRSMEMKVYEPQTLIWLALVYYYLHQFERAGEITAKALTTAQELHQRGNEGKAMRVGGMIGIQKILTDESGRSDENLKNVTHSMLQESLEILEQIDMQHEVGRTCVELARYYKMIEQNDEYKNYLARAKTIFQSLGAEGDLKRADRIG